MKVSGKVKCTWSQEIKFFVLHSVEKLDHIYSFSCLHYRQNMSVNQFTHQFNSLINSSISHINFNISIDFSQYIAALNTSQTQHSQFKASSTHSQQPFFSSISSGLDADKTTSETFYKVTEVQR